MTALCVVQARTGSTRFPGKVLAELGGRPMLAFLLERLGRAPVPVVTATTGRGRDDDVAEVATAAGVDVVRGDEDDVLGRFAAVLAAHPAETVVRITGDCPLTDPALIRTALEVHRRAGAAYTSNTLVRTFPDGLDVEVVSAAALLEAHAMARDPVEREHVTPYVYHRPRRYGLAAFTSGELLAAERWTVDTAEDLERVREIVGRLGNRFGWRDVLTVAGLRALPEPGAVLVRPGGDDPGRRVWQATVDERVVGTLIVDVDEGVGRLAADIEVDVADDAVRALQRALLADHQVVTLVVAEGLTTGTLVSTGFEETGAGWAWARG